MGVIPVDAGPVLRLPSLCIQVGGGRKELVRSYTPALVITRRPPIPSRGVLGFSVALFSQKPSLKGFAGLGASPTPLPRSVAPTSASLVTCGVRLRIPPPPTGRTHP